MTLTPQILYNQIALLYNNLFYTINIFRIKFSLSCIGYSIFLPYTNYEIKLRLKYFLFNYLLTIIQKILNENITRIFSGGR